MLLLAAILGPLIQGCSLVTSFDGYTGGQPVAGDAQPDAVPQEDGGADDRSTPSDGTGGDEVSVNPQSDARADGESVPDSESADIRVEQPGDSSETDSATTPDTGTVVDADAGIEAGTKSDSGAGTSDGSAASIEFMQAAAAAQSASASTIEVTFDQAQRAGDLVVVAIGWGSGSLTQIGDTVGNHYVAAVGPTRISGGLTQSIYYAKNIAAADAGTNTLTVTLSASTTPLSLVALEYAGLDPTSPLDVASGFGGRSSAPDSGSATTTSAPELVVGAGVTLGAFTGAGSMYTLRKLNGSGLGVAEDAIVSSVGTYSATAPLASSAYYVMQVATFR